MTSILESAEEAVTGAVEGVGEAVSSVFAGHPLAPPPSPAQPLPSSPPPLEPPLPPLLICPPAAPPPLSPPSIEVWAAQVPIWFWWTFLFTVLVAVAGTVAIVYILRELRRQNRGERLPREETMRSLAQLEASLEKRGY